MKRLFLATAVIVALMVAKLQPRSGGSRNHRANDSPIKYWPGDACPITGNKYGDADENDAMQGKIPRQFEHQGQRYEVWVWDESAIDRFATNMANFMPFIIANSK